MEKIRLELNTIDLEKKRRRWNLYIIVATENPDDPSEMVITLLPQDKAIRLRRPAENFISFVAEGEGADGLSVLERTIPDDRTIKVRLWLMHSKKGLRNIGEIMSDLKGNDEVKSVVGEISSLGNFNPWISLSLSTLGAVGQFLSKVKDKDLGYVSLDEEFEIEDSKVSLDRSNNLSTGFGKITWTWIQR